MLPPFSHHDRRPLLRFTNISLSPTVPLIQNEYVEYRILAPRNRRQHRICSKTNNFQQPRVLRASASATTRLTLCAVVVVSISHSPTILFDPPVRSEVCMFLYEGLIRVGTADGQRRVDDMQ